MTVLTAQPAISVEEVRKRPPQERIPYLGQIRVYFPLWHTIYEAIGCCHEDARIFPEPQGLLLVGPTGAGKSTLVRSYAQQFSPDFSGQHIHCPVLMTSVIAPATVKTLATRLLAALGDPRAKSGSIGELTLRLMDYFEECRVQMLILDEIQHFVDQDNNKLLHTVSDWLKGLIKDTRVACVLVGLQGSAEQVVYQNEQLGGLFGDPWRLAPFTWDKPDPQYEENLSDFQKLLVLLEQALPFREPSHLYKLDLAWRCYVATGGVLRYVMKLVSQTSKLALKEGREHLDQALFATAIQRSPKIIRHGVGNPFEHPELPEYKKPSEPEPGMAGAVSNRGQTPRPHQERLNEVLS